MAIFQHQQLFTGQIGHRHAVAVRPGVIFVNRQHHRLVKQRHFNKSFTLFDQREDRAVELAAIKLRQQLLRLRFVQIHLKFREGLMQQRNNMRQQIGAYGRDQPDMQRAGHGFTLLACHLFQHLDLAQYRARLVHQQQSSLGKENFAAGALKQHYAQFIFQFADLPAQRRLADVARVGCTAKMAVFR